MEILIASKLGGSAPLIVAAAVSGLAGLIVTWLVAAVAGPVIYADFAVFWALFFFMVSVLFGVQQEMARGVAAAEHAAGATASPWRRILAATGVVAAVVLVVLVLLGPSTLGSSWVAWSIPILVAVPCYVVVAAIQVRAGRYGPVDGPRPAAPRSTPCSGSRSPAWRCGSVVAPRRSGRRATPADPAHRRDRHPAGRRPTPFCAHRRGAGTRLPLEHRTGGVRRSRCGLLRRGLSRGARRLRGLPRRPRSSRPSSS